MGSKNVDRLSSLPEEIQSHILSLMPTKFAVQTCVLSKRWRYTWMSITNLDFDDQPPLGFTNLETFVDRVLRFCKSSRIESLRLNSSRIIVRKSSVKNWIDKAVMLNVRELDIQYRFFVTEHEKQMFNHMFQDEIEEFIGNPKRYIGSFLLPSSLFTCTTLTTLKICLGYTWECASVVSLPCLKTFDVVVFTNPLASAFKLIAGSPILENLSLEVVVHNFEDDYIFDIPTLKRLKLSLFRSSSMLINSIVLRVPKLEHLCLDESLQSFFEMEDVSSLVEASFSFERILFTGLLFGLLEEISGVKLLSLIKARDTPLRDPSLLRKTSPLEVFPNMERLELKGFWHFELIFKFLESSPELKEIYIEKLEGSRWIAPKLVPDCMLAKLTTIKFLNFKWRESDVPFLKFLLGNAKVLKTLIVNLETSSIEEETRLLLNLPRASSCCEIQFHRS